jgi:hypothetical protein
MFRDKKDQLTHSPNTPSLNRSDGDGVAFHDGRQERNEMIQKFILVDDIRDIIADTEDCFSASSLDCCISPKRSTDEYMA